MSVIYQNLKDAVLDLDPILIRTLSGFTIETAPEGFRVIFKFAFYGPDLGNLEEMPDTERASTVAQYPDIEVLLDGGVWPKDQIDELNESEILGGLSALQIPPNVKGNQTDAPKWVVQTHAGSQAEWIEWLNSIG